MTIVPCIVKYMSRNVKKIPIFSCPAGPTGVMVLAVKNRTAPEFKPLISYHGPIYARDMRCC